MRKCFYSEQGYSKFIWVRCKILACWCFLYTGGFLPCFRFSYTWVPYVSSKSQIYRILEIAQSSILLWGQKSVLGVEENDTNTFVTQAPLRRVRQCSVYKHPCVKKKSCILQDIPIHKPTCTLGYGNKYTTAYPVWPFTPKSWVRLRWQTVVGPIEQPD